MPESLVPLREKQFFKDTSPERKFDLLQLAGHGADEIPHEK